MHDLSSDLRGQLTDTGLRSFPCSPFSRSLARMPSPLLGEVLEVDSIHCVAKLNGKVLTRSAPIAVLT